MIGIAKKSAKIRGLIYALRGGWTQIGNCPKKWENKRVYALRSGWTITGIAKKCKIKRVHALGGGWTMIEIAKSAK